MFIFPLCLRFLIWLRINISFKILIYWSFSVITHRQSVLYFLFQVLWRLRPFWLNSFSFSFGTLIWWSFNAEENGRLITIKSTHKFVRLCAVLIIPYRTNTFLFFWFFGPNRLLIWKPRSWGLIYAFLF